jgi:hypothetical protein
MGAKKKAKPGPKADRLKIGGMDWEDALRQALRRALPRKKVVLKR